MNIEIHFDKITKDEVIVKHDSIPIEFDINNDSILTTSTVEKALPSLLEVCINKMVTIKMLKFDDYFIVDGPDAQTNYYKFEMSYPFIKKYTNNKVGDGAGAFK